MKKLLAMFTLIVLSVLVVACGDSNKSSTNGTSNSEVEERNSNATYKMKLGHQSPETTNIHQFAQTFSDRVFEETDGEVDITVYPFRQLGTDRELLEAMQFGTLDFAVINSPALSGFSPKASVLDLPFLFEDWDHVNAFFNSPIGDEFKMIHKEEANLNLLGVMNRGFRHITTNTKPIETIADMKGLTLRVSESPVYVDAYRALGTSPQSMNWGDAYTGLEQGAIDGQENTIDIIHDERVDEVQKYVSKTSMHFVFSFLMASEKNFEQLPEDIQKTIQTIALEVGQEMSKQNETIEADFEQKLIDKGMVINEFDTSQFGDIFAPVYEQWIKQHDDYFINEIEKLK